MTDPSLALQSAIGSLLAGSAPVTALIPATSILDSTSLPINSAQIIIGEGQTLHEELTVARDVCRVYLDLHVWTTDDSVAGCKAVTGAIRAAMRSVTPWAIEDHQVVDLILQTTRFLRDKEGDVPLAHAVMSINALLQEVAS